MFENTAMCKKKENHLAMNYHECRCDCHRNKEMRHVVPCCSGKCKVCKAFIRRGKMGDHLKEHEHGLSESEKAELVRGGFDVTEHKVLRSTQIGPFTFRVTDKGRLEIEDQEKVVWFLDAAQAQELKQWL